jgi:hypothetical protein
MLYRYAINDEGLLHRWSQRVCDYTAKLQQTATSLLSFSGSLFSFFVFETGGGGGNRTPVPR